jgi:hypothetical protein
MQHTHSIIDERAVDPHAAESALARLAMRTREAMLGACSAALLAVALAALQHFALAAALGAGALAGGFVALAARNDRELLIARLVGQRSAYSIPAVAQAASRLDTRDRRNELARGLTRTVMAATGLEPANPMLAPLPQRIEAHADEMLAIAYLLAREGVKVHPASLALLERLLTSSMRSPIYNPTVPEQHLRIALQRIRASIDG